MLLPKVYEEFRLIILQNPLLHIQGKLEKVSGVLNIKASTIKALPVEALLQRPRQITAAYDFTKCFDDHTIG